MHQDKPFIIGGDGFTGRGFSWPGLTDSGLAGFSLGPGTISLRQ